MLTVENEADESPERSQLDLMSAALEAERQARRAWETISDALDAEYERDKMQNKSSARVSPMGDAEAATALEHAESAAHSALAEARKVLLSTTATTSADALAQVIVAREMINEGAEVAEFLAFLDSLERYLSVAK